MNDETKLDKIAEDISGIKVSQISMAKDLEIHIYRTDLAEKRIEQVAKQLQPVQEHVALVNNGLKLLGGLAILTGFVLAVLQLVALL